MGKPKDRSQTSFLLGLWMMALALLAGCQKSGSAPQLIGRWVPQTASRKWIKGTNLCEIVLQPDGTFTAAAPDYMMGTFDKASGKVVGGKGRWSLAHAARFSLESDTVSLQFSEINGKPENFACQPLQIQEGKDHRALFFYVEEEGGERFAFVPAQTASPNGER